VAPVAELGPADRVRAWMELNLVPSTVAEIARGADVTSTVVTTVLGLIADAGRLETSGRPGAARYRLIASLPTFIRDLAAPVPPGRPPTQALPADIRTFLVAARAHYEAWKVALDNHSAAAAALTSAADDLLAKYSSRPPVRLDDLRALLAAVDTDYLSTDDLPALEERIDRLYAAVGVDRNEVSDAATDG
jgi:hypothetical protein